MPDTTTRLQQRRLTARLVAVQPNGRPNTLREDDRSVEFVAATEIPARVYDWERGVVDEVLLVSGIEIPDNRQVPFLDSHDHGTVESVLGSMRDFRRESDELIGRAFFSKKQKAFDAWRDVADGHLTDVSVGYEVTEATWVPEGERAIVAGREYTGPVKVSTRSKLVEVSLTPIGADAAAKVRSATPTRTDPEPSARGEPKQIIKEAQPMNPFTEWLKRGGFDPETITEQQKVVLRKQYDAEMAANAEAEKSEADKAAARAAAEAQASERKRVTEITEVCRTVQADDMAADLIKSGATVEQAIRAVHAKVAERLKPVAAAPVVTAGPTEHEKFSRAAVDSLVMRAATVEKPAPGAIDMMGMGLRKIAAKCVSLSGHNVERMSDTEIADHALGLRAGYVIANGSANFTEICRDAANKILQQRYRESPRVWDRICRVVEVPDFKTIYRPQLSEASNLAAINEQGEYTEAKFNEFAETYSVATYGKRYTLSRKAIVNDDTAAFLRVPAAMGDAAQRLIETTVIGILTTNAALGADSVALFDSATHANIGSGASFSATTVGSLNSMIRRAKGPGENTAYVGAPMRWLLVPEALRFSAIVACSPGGYITTGTNSATANPNVADGIQVLSSPILDASSTAYHYGFADPVAYDTLEVAFLSGSGRAPELFQADQVDPDGRVFHVRLDFGAKALDFRFMARHNGA